MYCMLVARKYFGCVRCEWKNLDSSKKSYIWINHLFIDWIMSLITRIEWGTSNNEFDFDRG